MNFCERRFLPSCILCCILIFQKVLYKFHSSNVFIILNHSLFIVLGPPRGGLQRAVFDEVSVDDSNGLAGQFFVALTRHLFKKYMFNLYVLKKYMLIISLTFMHSVVLNQHFFS